MTKLLLLPDPIADLWRSARAGLAHMLREFGRPAAIAAAVVGEAFKRRLNQLEALVARLLLIEAARLPGATPTRAACARASRSSRRALPAEDPARSETWRVRFNARTGGPPSHRAAPPAPVAPATPAERAHAKSRALARRLEALRRVLANPHRAIAALARKLAALGAGAYAA